MKIISYNEENAIVADAHEHAIECLQFSYDGNYLATCSDGKIIKIFDTQNGQLKQSLRRGSKNCVIYSMSFSFDNQYLAVANDHNSIHIFSLETKSRKSIIGNIKNILIKPVNNNYNDDRADVIIKFEYANKDTILVGFNEEKHNQL